MANARITIDELPSAIERLMVEYTDEVEQELEKAQEKVAKEGVQTLKATSPEKRPKYARSWKSKKVNDGHVIYNTEGQLTHLLEKGHALRQGGRTRAFVHIYPVEQTVIKRYEEEFIRAVSG